MVRLEVEQGKALLEMSIDSLNGGEKVVNSFMLCLNYGVKRRK